MIVQHNLPALNAKGYFDKNVAGVKKSSEKLASGYRINRAGDDAAGLAVSEKMRTQIRGIKQSIRNSQDGINLVQTFEGALGETVHIIHRMNELAVESANGTYDNDVDRTAVQLEFKQLSSEINEIADTDFNGLCMLNGGRMADGFTFVSDHGTTWITPSELSFPKDGFSSTFEKIEGFPEVEMNIEMFPEAKDKMTSDRDLVEAFSKLNRISVRSYYNNGIPEFSLVGVQEEDKDVFSIETVDGVGIISITTPGSGTIPTARVTSTELPHYASSIGTGVWDSNSAGSGYYTDPVASTPGNAAFDVNKYKKSYVDGSNATREDRQKYLDWINAISATGTLVNDTVFDKDTDKQKIVWSSDGQTYELPVDDKGNPIANKNGVKVPVYSDTSHGPQIFFDNIHFYKNDEDFKPAGTTTIRLYSYTDYNYISGSSGGKPISAGNPYMSRDFYLNTWLDHGNRNVTLTYNKEKNQWYDSIGGENDLHDASYYGIDFYYYSKSEYNIKYGYEARNLYHFYEKDGKLRDGFTLNISVTTPFLRSYNSGGYQYYNTWRNDDLTMGEFDPASPAAGGVDYKVARHGAVYIYDGTEQPDGTFGAWKDEGGNTVNLEDEGVHLPTSLDSTETLPLHDGMKITVSNPTMVGEDYIQARILSYDSDVNAYSRVYENITYSENLILQVNSRSKDAVNFKFCYNTSGIGNLQADLNCSAKGLGITELSLATQEDANHAIDGLGYALNKVSMVRATFGAVQNRLEHKINDLTVTNENITASESQIRDTDMAVEEMNFTKSSLLQQAAQTMLAQMSRQPESILELLG